MKTVIRTLFRTLGRWFRLGEPVPAQPTPDRFLVRFKDGTAAGTRSAIHTLHGCRVVDCIPGINVQVMAVPRGKNLDQMLEIYGRNPNVEFAEPDYVAHAALVPNDPYFKERQKNLQAVGAPAAWRHTTGSRAVTVAVLDTGVMHAHQDLAGRLLEGYDFINNTNRPGDGHGHGTAVAGVIGAATNNEKGIAGITWQGPVLPVKVLGRDASGHYSVIARGIIYAADQGARVINLSLGGPHNSSTLKKAVDHALQRKAVVVAAAGNSNGPVLYPAAYPHVIAVAAVDEYDRRASYSNFGPEVSVAAPGNNIWSTTAGGDYRTHSGTSFAAPMVAGLAGLILSLQPELGPDEVRRIIERSAVDLGEPGWDKYYGWGRIDMAATLAGLAPATSIDAGHNKTR